MSDSAGCSPLSVQFNSSGSVNANMFTWDFGDGQISNARNPFRRFDNLDDTVKIYKVSLVADKAAVGCPSYAERTIRVFPLPRVAFTPTDTSNCQPFRVLFRNNSVGIDSLVWTFTSNDTTTTRAGLVSNLALSVVDTTFRNANAAFADTKVNLTAYNQYGCEAQQENKVRTAPLTEAAFELPIDSACSPFALEAFSNSSTGTALQWLINGVPTGATSSRLRTRLFNFTDRDSVVFVSLVATNRLAPTCTDTVTQRVVIMAKPKANQLVASPDNGCSPILVELNGNATGAVLYRWDLNDGTEFDSTSQTISHLFTNFNTSAARTFRVRQVAINTFGCADTTTADVREIGRAHV